MLTPVSTVALTTLTLSHNRSSNVRLSGVSGNYASEKGASSGAPQVVAAPLSLYFGMGSIHGTVVAVSEPCEVERHGNESRHSCDIWGALFT
jgi:hypothetical protein